MTAQLLTAAPGARRERGLWPPVLLIGGWAVALAIGLSGPGWYEQAVLTVLLGTLAWIASFDSYALRAPNRVVYPLAAVASVAPLTLGIDTAMEAVAGGLLAFGLLLVAVLASRGAMGYGDAKVAYVCGAVLGASNVLLFVLATFAVGSAFAGAMLALRIRGRKDVVAFTPFMFVGVSIALVWGGGSVYLPAGG